jgi:hypothetical protein
MEMQRRTRFLTMAGLTVSTVLAAVGGVAAGASARTIGTQQVSAASPAITSASFTFSVNLSGLGAHALSVTGAGQIDFVNDAVSTSIVLPPSVASLLPGGGGSSETVNAVLVGGTFYVEVPGLSGLSGTPWISLALPGGGLGGSFSGIASALANVSQIVSFASSHHATVKPLPPSNVDNTAVTGNSITVGSGSIALEATLWANSSDQLVQGILNVGMGSGPSLSARIDLSGYDAPVSIAAPPSSEVTPLPSSLVQPAMAGVISNTKSLNAMVAFTDSHLVKKGHHRGHRGHGAA